METAALTLNALVSLASAAWAIVALGRPGTLSGSEAPAFGERYYARLYAVRSVPFELLVAVLPVCARSGTTFALLLAAAGVQGADAVIGLLSGRRAMALGASTAAVVHMACAVILR